MASEKRKDSDDILSKVQEDQREFWKGMRELKESQREATESQREFKESMRELRESQRETKIFVEGVAKAAADNYKAICEANGNFNRKWGDFMENLIEGDLVSLLRSWGLEMIDAEIRPIPKATVSRDDGTTKYEYDLIVKNGDYAIIVEVKTTLTVPKIDKFLKKLSTLKDDLPAYKGKTIYACMAYLKTNKGKEEEDRVLPYLNEKGLFAIRAPGGPSNIATIENSKDFKPKTF